MYSEVQMKRATAAVRNGQPVRIAVKLYNVPGATLFDKIKGWTPIERKMGRDPYLTSEEEKQIVDWIHRCGRRSLPPKVDDIFNSVQNIDMETGRKTPFYNNRQGRFSFKGFSKRHQEISIRKPESIPKARVGIIEELIRALFSALVAEKTEIGAFDVFEDPSRVYNCDETNFQLCPSTGRVVGLKNWKNVYELAPGPEKSTLTSVGTINARGDVVTPGINLYPYVRIPADISARIPDGFF